MSLDRAQPALINEGSEKPNMDPVAGADASDSGDGDSLKETQPSPGSETEKEEVGKDESSASTDDDASGGVTKTSKLEEAVKDEEKHVNDKQNGNVAENGKAEEKDAVNKRKYHKESEKKRREKINRLIEDLIELVPMCRNSPYKLDKLTALKMAVFHLKMLKQKKAAEGIFSPFKPLSIREEEMRFLLEHASNGFLFVLASERAQILYISEMVTDIIGCTPASMIGRSLYTMIHARDIPILKEQIKPFGSLPSVTRARAARMQNGGRLEPEVGCMSGSRRSFYCRFRAVGKSSETDSPSEFRLIDKVDSRTQDVQYEDGNFFVTVFCTGFLKTWQVVDRPLYEVPDDIELSTSTCFIGIGRSVCPMPSLEKIKMNRNTNFFCPTAFTSRHSADAKFLYVDSSVVPICGFLPQDLVGQSEYDYVHHDDVSVLADTFRRVIHLKEQEKVFSKVYRAKVKGGGVVQMRTVAFSLFNPFSKELEYIVRRNYVVCENGRSANSPQRQPLELEAGSPAELDSNTSCASDEKSTAPTNKEDGTPKKITEKSDIGREKRESAVASSPWISPGPAVPLSMPSMPLLVSPVTAQLVLSRPGHVVDPASVTIYASPLPLADTSSDAKASVATIQFLRTQASKLDNNQTSCNPKNPDETTRDTTDSLSQGVAANGQDVSTVNQNWQDTYLSKEAEENVRILATTALALHDGNSFSSQNPCLNAESGKLSGTDSSANHRHSGGMRVRKGPGHGRPRSEGFAWTDSQSHDRLGRSNKCEQKQGPPATTEAKERPPQDGLLSYIQSSVGKAVRNSLPLLLEHWCRENNLVLTHNRHSHVRHYDRTGSLSSSPSDSHSSDSGSSHLGMEAVEPALVSVVKCKHAQTARKTSVISCVGKCSSSDGSYMSSETSDPGSSEEEESAVKKLQGCLACKATSNVICMSKQGVVGDSLDIGVRPVHSHDNPAEHPAKLGKQDCSLESLSNSIRDITAMVSTRKRKRVDRRDEGWLMNQDSPSRQVDSTSKSDVGGEIFKRHCVAASVCGQANYSPVPADSSIADIFENCAEGLPLFPGSDGADGGGYLMDRSAKGKSKTYAQMVGSVENVLRDHLLGGVAYAGRKCDTAHLAARIMSILGINGLPKTGGNQ